MTNALRGMRRPAPDSAAVWLCAALAVGVHGAILFAWKYAPQDNAAPAFETDNVEVALVESSSAAGAANETQPPATQPPQAPDPAPLPVQEPPKREPEMTIPETQKPTPEPRPPSAATPSPKAKPQPPTPRKSSAENNSPTGGSSSGSGSPNGTTGTGNGTGKGAKAHYIVPPLAAYPPGSRAAGEQGTVILRIVVGANGKPAQVSIAKSSGFPRLDRAAVDAGWRSRVRDAAPGSQLDAPVRFNLGDR